MASSNVISKTILKLCILALISLNQCASDAKGARSSYNTEDVNEFGGSEASRSGRSIFSFQNNFMFEVLRQSPASVFLPLNSQGNLEFIMDQYPTPGKIQYAIKHCSGDFNIVIIVILWKFITHQRWGCLLQRNLCYLQINVSYSY